MSIFAVSNHRRATVWILLLASLGLHGCKEKQQPDDTFSTNRYSSSASFLSSDPQPSASDRKLQAFLSAHYGDSARLENGWEQEDRNQPEQRVRRSVCAKYQDSLAGESRLWLAVCSVHNDSSPDAAGSIDFYLLRESPDQLEIIASALNQPTGGVENTVSVIPLGREMQGFKVANSKPVSTGQPLNAQSLWIVKVDTVVPAAYLSDRADHHGASSWEQCKEDPTGACQAKFIDLRYDMQIDVSNSDASLYPLKISESGIECGTPVQHTYTLTFDQTQWQYVANDIPVRNNCAAATASIPANENPTDPALTPFEQMLSGFPQCLFGDLYLDSKTGYASHPYLRGLNIEPCSIDTETGVAYYCLEEFFHDLPVYQFAIPIGAPELKYAIQIDLPVEEAREILRQNLGAEFNESEQSERGRAPRLMEYPDPDHSILICNIYR
ncbi:MAG: hypothetical protein LBV45_04305 [Xanthomonadaceae bacterium]|jgi:hypothetical protein|nr:hypothetical protein [Xanthomonadaceae bacterium]